MRDREAINRFCAFSLIGWRLYRADMDVFLATALTNMNSLPDEALASLRKGFDLSMRVNRKLFGDHAFRKSLAEEAPARRNILNIALFDVCSVLISASGQQILSDARCADRVRRRIIALVLNKDFSFAITYSTNSTKSVATRFGMAEEAFGAA
jgi:hypothetical protein